MTTSISTRSGVSARALATPSAPLSAVSTSCLCFSRMVEIFLTSVGESSTIRMRAMVSSMVLGVQQVLLFRLRHVVADGVEQLILAEGFGQILVGAYDAAFSLVEQAVLARKHDYRRLLERGIVLDQRSEEHTSELQSRPHLVCR